MIDLTRLSAHVPGLTLQRVVVVTSLFIVLYGGFTIFGNASRGYQLAQQEQQLQQSIARDQAEYAQLDALRRYMQTDAFIEAQARREGLGMPGDVPVLVSAPTATPSEHQSGGPWWERYFGR